MCIERHFGKLNNDLYNRKWGDLSLLSATKSCLKITHRTHIDLSSQNSWTMKVAFVIHTTLLLDRNVIKCVHPSSAAMPRWQSLWSLCCSVTTCRVVLKHRLAARCFLRVDKRGTIDRPSAHPTNQRVTKFYLWVRPGSHQNGGWNSDLTMRVCCCKSERTEKERHSYCQRRYLTLGWKAVWSYVADMI